MQTSKTRRELLETLGPDWCSLGTVIRVSDPITAWTTLNIMKGEGLVESRGHPSHQYRLTRKGLDAKEHPNLGTKPLPECLTCFCSEPGDA